MRDAVGEAEATAAKVSADAKLTMAGKRGMVFVFEAARNAAEQATGEARRVIFAAAPAAAKAALI